MTDGSSLARSCELRLVEAARPPRSSVGDDGKASRVPRLRGPQGQLDLVVDGVRLSRLIQDLQVPDPQTSGFADPFDLISIVDPVWPGGSAEDLQRLAGDLPRDEATWPLDPDRLPLYVCSQCADLACGAVTAAVAPRRDGNDVERLPARGRPQR